MLEARRYLMVVDSICNLMLVAVVIGVERDAEARHSGTCGRANFSNYVTFCSHVAMKKKRLITVNCY